MTDGTTGIPVAPITEDSDMAKIREVFDRALNAIVSATQLAKDVEALRQQVSAMQSDIEHYRRTINTQDEALARLRQERDEYRNLSESLRADLSVANATASAKEHEAAEANAKVQSLTQSLTEARKDRDDAELREMDLEDELREVKAKLAKIEEVFGPRSEPKPETPAETPAIPPEPAKTRTFYSEWAPGRSWDETANQYYDEA